MRAAHLETGPTTRGILEKLRQKKRRERLLAWHHRAGFVLLSAGFILLLFGGDALEEQWARRRSPYESSLEWSLDISKRPLTSEWSCWWDEKQVRTSPVVISAWWLSGFGLLALGVLWTFKRFSIRGLLAAVLLTGLVGGVPSMALNLPRLRSRIEMRTMDVLSSQERSTLRKALQPEAALRTLPPAFLEAYGLDTEANNVHVTIQDESLCILEFSPALSWRQREALTAFYGFYLPYWYTEQQKRPCCFPSAQQMGGLWRRWEAAWVRKRLLDTPFSGSRDRKKTSAVRTRNVP